MGLSRTTRSQVCRLRTFGRSQHRVRSRTSVVLARRDGFTAVDVVDCKQLRFVQQGCSVCGPVLGGLGSRESISSAEPATRTLVSIMICLVGARAPVSSQVSSGTTDARAGLDLGCTLRAHCTLRTLHCSDSMSCTLSGTLVYTVLHATLPQPGPSTVTCCFLSESAQFAPANALANRRRGWHARAPVVRPQQAGGAIVRTSMRRTNPRPPHRSIFCDRVELAAHHAMRARRSVQLLQRLASKRRCADSEDVWLCRIRNTGMMPNWNQRAVDREGGAAWRRCRQSCVRLKIKRIAYLSIPIRL